MNKKQEVEQIAKDYFKLKSAGKIVFKIALNRFVKSAEAFSSLQAAQVKASSNH